jgi:bacterioferritin-associated ferredoxin
MLVCQCNGVSDRTIRRVIRAGASSVRQVARGCGAGASCGDCALAIRRLIRAEAPDARRVQNPKPAPAPTLNPAT